MQKYTEHNNFFLLSLFVFHEVLFIFLHHRKKSFFFFVVKGVSVSTTKKKKKFLWCKKMNRTSWNTNKFNPFHLLTVHCYNIQGILAHLILIKYCFNPRSIFYDYICNLLNGYKIPTLHPVGAKTYNVFV